MKLPNLTTTVWLSVSIAGVVVFVFLWWVFQGTSIIIDNEPEEIVSSLTGLPCPNAHERPIAVMLASDPEARPLSGIGQADMVFEMPVTPNGITRMMGVFQCTTPKEIGSIRSARGDFIPLAQGLDVILAHWGGERDALAALDGHVIDNVDAMKYEGSTFYRKASIPRPHNGFTTLKLVEERAEDLGYRASSSMTSYPHTTDKSARSLGTAADTVTVAWPQQMDVRFSYDQTTKSYMRWRGGEPEIDTTTKKQVAASVVVVLQTTASFLYDQYISVKTIGQGTATIWQNGRRIDARWKKPTATSMLTFIDAQGAEIPFAPGPIWVLIDAPLPAVN